MIIVRIIAYDQSLFLNNRYLKPMECDLIKLKDFGGRYHVCSYRLSKFSDNFLATKARLAKDQYTAKHHGSDGMTDTST